MKLLVTGASGFLGKYVVAEAVRCGHNIRALVRPATKSLPETWHENPQIEIVYGDLRASGGLSQIIEGVDGVIHLAASKAGDLYEQFGGTVIATENLLIAMSKSGIKRIVLTSTFSVYEYLKRCEWGKITESSLLATNPFDRDEYCQTKMEQEKLVMNHAKENDWRCMILRPGVIFGKENLWTARLGMKINSKWWIATGLFACLPLTYVENCASAIVASAQYDGQENISVLNVVDGKSPTQLKYIHALKNKSEIKPHIVLIPWTIMKILARTAWLVNHIFFKGTAKIPGLFVPSRIHARCKPLLYSNRKINSVLGWKARYTWREGIERSYGEKF